jgi:pimeloyl-ACP methyl ester carboxylesterase
MKHQPQFMLIHGGMHGSWVWEPLLAELHARGAAAFAFDLPGHGNNRLFGEDDIDDDPDMRILRLYRKVSFEDYLDAASTELVAAGDSGLSTIIVAHSIAGMLIPPLVAEHWIRVSRAVFLAALVLNRGESALSLMPEDRKAAYAEQAAASRNNTVTISPDEAKRRFFPDLPPDRQEAAAARLVPQPFAPYKRRAKVGPRAMRKGSDYIATRDDLTFPIEMQRKMAKRLGKSGRLHEMDGDHDVMLSRPAELADLLIGIRDRRR